MTLSIVTHFHHAEFVNVERRVLFIVMLNVVMLSVVWRIEACSIEQRTVKWAPILLGNEKLGYKTLQLILTEPRMVLEKKSFITTLTPRANVIKLFLSVIYRFLH